METTCSVEGCGNPVKARGWCQTHYRRWQRRGTTDLEWGRGEYPRAPREVRFWAKVEKSVDCWLWVGATNEDGYGLFRWEGQGFRGVHRIAYELMVGPIPEGLTIDHLCRVRSCVRPEHLEPVPLVENIRRGTQGHHNAEKTHCIRGHAFAEHGFIDNLGKRQCRICAALRQRRYRESKRRDC